MAVLRSEGVSESGTEPFEQPRAFVTQFRLVVDGVERVLRVVERSRRRRHARVLPTWCSTIAPSRASTARSRCATDGRACAISAAATARSSTAWRCSRRSCTTAPRLTLGHTTLRFESAAARSRFRCRGRASFGAARRALGGDARTSSRCSSGRRSQGDAAPRGRDRHRQGGGGGVDASASSAARAAVRRRRLRGAPAESPRERALRPREGRVHRRQRAPRRRVRGGARRHHVPRRDRRARARAAAQAPARARAPGGQARRRRSLPARSTCASSPRRTATCAARSTPSASAPTSTTGSRSWR